ncbi:aminoglycoside phosphotransferase family protein [Bacillus sp. Cr_A10]|uniref:aminoglycoside phosphotransferase family protein n=1 Tax=Bacillus sp. Cr_A10 TaxID=3033993 RepID=UPI0023DCACE8|nr:aminoglycoside phosphotransferase family protein [Bacillus sp. Cr_A10]
MKIENEIREKEFSYSMYPERFEKKIIGAFGKDGKEFLYSLETTINEFLHKWNLISEGPVDNLSYNYVLKVKDQDGNPAILKLGVPNYDFKNEIRTLQTYNGKGCVKLLDADTEKGVMLLEHLLPGTMLNIVEEQEAIKYFAKVWMEIRRPIKGNSDHPFIKNWLSAFDRYLETYSIEEGPISNDYIYLAKTFYSEISDSSKGNELLHGDLHHENILFSKAYGWIAIDPKGVIGDTYFDLISFLTNQLFDKPNPQQFFKDRVFSLCDEMNLDKERLLKAGFTMSTLYACWGIEDNDPEWGRSFTCAQWFNELRGII